LKNTNLLRDTRILALIAGRKRGKERKQMDEKEKMGGRRMRRSGGGEEM
jgi:hypothetical protein